MIEYPHRVRQQLQGGGTMVVALAGLGLAAARGVPVVSARDLGLAVALMGGTVLAYRFPLYLRHGTKLCIFSIPLLMLAALLPPAAAGAGALVAILTGEMLVRASRGTLIGDVLMSAARWALMVLAASAVAHLSLSPGELSIFGAAAVLWLGDLLTLPLLLCPITDERPLRVLQTVAREGGFAEAIQYSIGILGVILIQQLPWTIVLFILPAVLIHVVFRKRLDHHTMTLLERTADSVELRDPYLDGHAQRVEEYVRAILYGLGMHGQEAEQILIAARLHDLGKMHLPTELALKSEALTPEDHAMIQQYPERGAELLAAYPELSRTLEMVRHHHEAWDGSGYPSCLAGTDIPFGSRVIAVADAFDAMTHERPHRPALPVNRALEILRNGRGRQWDPRIVEVFLASVSSEMQDDEAARISPVVDGSLPARGQVPA